MNTGITQDKNRLCLTMFYWVRTACNTGVLQSHIKSRAKPIPNVNGKRQKQPTTLHQTAYVDTRAEQVIHQPATTTPSPALTHDLTYTRMQGDSTSQTSRPAPRRPLAPTFELFGRSHQFSDELRDLAADQGQLLLGLDGGLVKDGQHPLQQAAVLGADVVARLQGPALQVLRLGRVGCSLARRGVYLMLTRR